MQLYNYVHVTHTYMYAMCNVCFNDCRMPWHEAYSLIKDHILSSYMYMVVSVINIYRCLYNTLFALHHIWLYCCLHCCSIQCKQHISFTCNSSVFHTTYCWINICHCYCCTNEACFSRCIFGKPCIFYAIHT